MGLACGGPGLRVIINADDFGMDGSCTAAILEAFERGFVTSTTAMCNMEGFAGAAARIMGTPYKGRVGIHFVLTEGRPLTEAIRRDPFFCDGDGMFHGRVKRFQPFGAERKRAVYGELRKQAEAFAASGLAFHHADSHHHVHTVPAVAPIVRRVMEEFHIQKLRIHKNVGPASLPKRAFKAANNGLLKLEGLAYSDLFCGYRDAEAALSSGSGGLLEIMCHPDYSGPGALIDRQGRLPDGTPFGDGLAERFASLGAPLERDGCFVRE